MKRTCAGTERPFVLPAGIVLFVIFFHERSPDTLSGKAEPLTVMINQTTISRIPIVVCSRYCFFLFTRKGEVFPVMREPVSSALQIHLHRICLDLFQFLIEIGAEEVLLRRFNLAAFGKNIKTGLDFFR